ncbi:MAG: UDP-N-acetylmuramoyl-tripeptide--D-alanyl-D-alanine ligase, partial [Betaproteobacteria bacterium]
MLELRRVFEWLNQASFIGSGNERVSGVCTDSRAIDRDSLFVALRGERFDAHDFVQAARDSGAGAVLVERWVPGLAPPVIRVSDSRRALGEIARGWRRQFQLPVVAVTGSNGKTTVKEMIAAIFTECCGAQATLATRGNLNNEIGVPMTLLALRERHRLAVIELGMNHAGEIAWLAEITRPTISLVNNAQREHQEFLASVAATARENGTAISALATDGIAVYPGDDADHTPIWRALGGTRRALEFGRSVDGRSASGTALAVWAEPGAAAEDFRLHAGAEVHRV